MSYYNTNSESGELLKSSQIKAITQDDIILEMFHKWPEMSPSQCWQRYDGFRVNALGLPLKITTPITSIRRSFTSLTDILYIEKTDKMVMGNWGKNEHVWKLNK